MGDRYGVADRPELRAIGVSDEQIDYRVAESTLLPIHDSVYRHAAAPWTLEGALRAAVLAARPDIALVSGPSAMRLYGVRGVWDDVPEIIVAGDHRHLLRGVNVRRIDQIDALDIGMHLGIPALSVSLALLLLGATESERKVETAMHDAVYLRLTTRPELVAVLDRYAARGRRGVTKFRKALKALPADGKVTERNLELDLVQLLRLHGLPEPRLQYEVFDANGVRRRLDLAYPDAMLDIEADGDRWHKSEIDRRRDAHRDLALEAVGWQVQRYGPDEIHQWPSMTVGRIRRSLVARAGLSGAGHQRTGLGGGRSG
jgi:very-short-patch-repair endonuclease